MKGKWLLGVLLLTMLSGCAVNPEVRTTAANDSALIYGFFDMRESPYELSCVRITQDERSGIAYRQSCMTTLPNGLFFLENVPAMKYHVPFFYAGGKLHMISSEQQDVFSVKPNSVHFVGAFKYKVVEKNLGEILQITPEKYGLIPVKKPDEKSVLKMLLEHVKEPASKQRIKERLQAGH